MSAETHIAGILVQVRNDCLADVATTISGWPETEVHASSGLGKLVVVSECTSADQTLELMARMRDLPGVLNVALVYQHAESPSALDEEIQDENDAPRVH